METGYPYILKFRLLADYRKPYKNAELYHFLSDAEAAFDKYIASNKIHGVILILEEIHHEKVGKILESRNKILRTYRIPFKQKIKAVESPTQNNNTTR